LLKKIRKLIRDKKKRVRYEIELFFLKIFETPFKEIEKISHKKTNFYKHIIPNIVYQTWIDNKFGKSHAQSIKKFRSMNPDMEFRLFDTSELDIYMQKSYGCHPIFNIYKNTKFGPMKADIFRYCILYEMGGFYVDIKSSLSKQISELCPADVDGFIAFESSRLHLPPDDNCLAKIQHIDRYVVQWGMGFKKEHPILKEMIESICLNYDFYKGRVFENPKDAILLYTGPGKFTQVVRNQIANNDLIKVYQAGIDFHGFGNYEVRGSRSRYIVNPAYINFSSTAIVY